MHHMVVFVMIDPDPCRELLLAWEKAGCIGITIFESSGLGRIKDAGVRDDLPLMPSLMDIFRGQEVNHRTIFSVVDSEEKVDAVVEATHQVIGDLDQEHTGFLFVLPVSRVYGMSRTRKKD